MQRIAFLLTLAACAARPPDAPDAGAPAPDAAAPSPAEIVATTDPRCTGLGPFYWEIGDAQGPIDSGSVGGDTAETAMDIASASKLIFGAYVVERFAGDLSQIDHRAMTMQSGYTSLVYPTCVAATSVDDCLQRYHNADHTTADDDHFFYNGGHFQHYASVALGLGGDDNAQLAADIGGPIGYDDLAYSSPQLAAGVHTTPASYARFLRRILDGTLAIHDALGADPVCTLPGASCPAAHSSPAPYAWHYSYGHWVEDDPAAGDDGAFSSPGAFGFYPWIDATRTYYGIVAREEHTTGAYLDSARCGEAIRTAFLSAR